MPILLLYNQIWEKKGMKICEDIEPADQESCADLSRNKLNIIETEGMKNYFWIFSRAEKS